MAKPADPDALRRLPNPFDIQIANGHFCGTRRMVGPFRIAEPSHRQEIEDIPVGVRDMKVPVPAGRMVRQPLRDRRLSPNGFA